MVNIAVSSAIASLAFINIKATNSVLKEQANRLDKFTVLGLNIIFDPLTGLAKSSVLLGNYQEYC